MKKTVLLLCAIVCLARAGAQTCMPDSSILGTNQIVSPAPWTPDFPFINTLPACIGEPYLQSVTFNVPDTAAIPNVPFPVPINSITVATTGAVENLPAGITYLCDPPNCVFQKNTLGCVLLYGTPTGPTDTADLTINVKVSSPLFAVPIPLKFPADVAPSSHYYIVVKNMGECAVGTSDLSGQIASVKNVPNPFGDQTLISVESNVSGTFRFEVFDLTGRSIHHQNVNMLTGSNQFTFEAGELPNGAYYYTLGNADGRVSRMMVISR